MRSSDYRAALNAAHVEIQELLKERAALDERLSQLKRTTEALSLTLAITTPADPGFGGALASISEASGLSSPGRAGISDAIRSLLADSQVPMSASEIKFALSRQGFNFVSYANPLAVIHNTLRRLQKQGELMGVTDSSGRVAYAIVPTRTQLLRRGQEIIDGTKE